MKRLLILGAGTAGTMMAAHLKKKLNLKEWKITIVDAYETHYYQPGFLFIPFGTYTEKDVIKKKKDFIPKKVEYIQKKIEKINPKSKIVELADSSQLNYDILIIATGTKIVPEETPGMKDKEWHKSIFDFYTIEGSTKLHKALENFNGGEIVVHITEMPIKCPVAPLEFAFLLDSYLKKRKIRDKTKIKYVTPLSGAFTKQNCSEVLGHLLSDKGIELIPDFNIESIDNDNKQMISFDEKKIGFDLLVTIPVNMGDDLIERSGLGDELNFIPTHPNTLQSQAHKDIFVIGDATNLTSSKAGSVAHFQSEILTENIQRYIKGEELKADFDGHANCFIESGNGKAFLIDFNYDLEPLEGTFPLPYIGPLPLLKESRLCHIGKLAFRYIYWHVLLKALPMPLVTPKMKYSGKKIPDHILKTLKDKKILS